jgi:hypothetical protein
MAYDISYDPKRNLAVVRHFGSVDRDDLWNGREAAMKLVSGKEFPRILVDLLDIEFEMTSLEDFEFAQAQPNYYSGNARVAVMIKKNDPQKVEHEFISTLSLNRGVLVMVFNDRIEAEKWLMG